MMRRTLLGRLVPFMLLLGGEAAAKVVNVSSGAALTQAIGAAQPGDEIVLAAGTYSLAGADWRASPRALAVTSEVRQSI